MPTRAQQQLLDTFSECFEEPLLPRLPGAVVVLVAEFKALSSLGKLEQVLRKEFSKPVGKISLRGSRNVIEAPLFVGPADQNNAKPGPPYLDGSGGEVNGIDTVIGVKQESGVVAEFPMPGPTAFARVKTNSRTVPREAVSPRRVRGATPPGRHGWNSPR